MNLRNQTFAFTLVAGTALLQGQATAPPADDDASALLALLNTPVESASKRTQKAIESPQAVEVITADQIRASGAFRLVDVLRLATSLQVWDEDADRAMISLRGLAPGGSARRTHRREGSPSTGCRTLGREDFMRLPRPAARTRAMVDMNTPSRAVRGSKG